MKHFSPNRGWLIALFIFVALSSVRAQGTWNFAAPQDGAGGNASVETGKGICTDASGNVYMAGVFSSSTGATDFDLANGPTNTFVSAGNDGFIASYDKNGNFRWKTIISGTGSDFQIYFTGTATNGTYVWVAGSAAMAGSPQIMSGSNTVTLTSGTGLPASVDAMVAKLDCSNGAVQWATTFGGSGGNDFATGITIDPNGSCYTLGAYSGAFTLGSVSAPALVGASSDEYVAKITPGGTLRYIRCGGSAGVDMQGNGGGICYVPGASPTIIGVGSFNYPSATFGSFTVTNSGSANNNDMLLLELDTTLTVTNAIGMGTGTTNTGEELYGAVYDPSSGGVYISGYFNAGTLTVPGAGNLNSAGGEDIFIGRYSVASNNFTWANSAGGASNDRSFGITADGQGGIILCGNSSSSPTCSFGSVSVSVGNGANDIVVARYNSSGTAIWGLAAGGNAGDDARGIASYVETTPVYTQNLYVTGNFQNSVTFGSTTLTADGTNNNDFFLARINDATVPLSATQSQVNLTCNGVCTGSATVVASGGSAPYTYSWSPSGGSGATASSLCAINYTCTITDATSTSITKTFSITQPPAIIITPVSQTNVGCNGGATGAAQVTASGGTGSLTYNWTPGNPSGDGTGSVTGLTAQVYTVTVTDANSCNATRTFNITQPAALVVTPLSQTNISCNGGSNGAASVTVSGGTTSYSYNWTPGNPTGDGTASVTGLTAGTWTCTVTDANSCVNTATFNITAPSAIVVTPASQTNISCNGGSNGAASINTPTGGAGGYTYNWTPGNPTGDGTISVTGLTAGTWTCTVTDANSCVSTATFNITAPTALVVTPVSQTNVSCNGGSNGAASVSVSGGTTSYSYNWTPGNPTGDGTASVTGLSAGTWTCTVTDANSCVSTATFNITSPTALVVTPASQTNISCNGGSNGAASVSVSGGTTSYSYNWTPGNPTGDGTASVTGLSAGTWTCTVTDANSCVSTATFNITEPATAVSGSTLVTNVSCNGGSDGAINLTPSGGTSPYTFNWLPSGPTTEDRAGLSAGTYSVQITDANGCNGTVTTTVTEPSSPVSGSTLVTNVSCNGGSDGAINLTPSGGTSPYTFNWLPSGPTTEDRAGLSAGTYSVQITDANGCSGTVTATVTEPSSPVSGSTVVTNITCPSGSNGAIDLTPSGGTSPYTFNWLPGGPTTEDRTGLTAATYSVQITDANGCNGTVTATVTEPSPFSVLPSSTPESCSGNDGTASVVVSGGTPSYSYSWSPSGGTSATATGLTAGTYTCTIADANGCSTTATVAVTGSGAGPTVSVSSSTNVLCFGGSNGAASVNLSGGSSPYTYAWTPSGGTAATATGLGAGTYTCTVTDSGGCTGSATVNITEPAALSVSITPVSAMCVGDNRNLVTSVSGGTPSYAYSWTPGAMTTANVNVSPASTTVYTVSVTDGNGCNATATVNVTVNTPPTISVVSNPASGLVCAGNNATLTASGAQSYSWTGGITNGVAFTPSSTQTYTVTGTNAAGCTATAQSTITVQSCSQSTVPCGQTITNKSQSLSAVNVPGATQYRFRFYNNSTLALVQSITQTSRTFTFSSAPNLNYGTTYRWTVAVNTGSGFGAESSINCTVILGIPTAPPPCGYTYNRYNGYSAVVSVVGAVGYRFTFYDNVTSALVAQVTQPSNYIYFNGISQLSVGATYKWTVEVQYYNGSGNVFGPASNMNCTVNMAAPTTTVPCNGTYNRNTGYTAAVVSNGATGYRFSFYQGATLIAQRAQTSNYIYFTNVSGLLNNATYQWTVEVQYNPGSGNVYGPASTPCNITFSNAVRLQQRSDGVDLSDESFNFGISMYPNPLMDGQSPTIEIAGADQQDAVISVMDLTGRVITTYMMHCEGEEFTAQLSEFPDLVAGMYIIQVTVGDKVQSQRFIAE